MPDSPPPLTRVARDDRSAILLVRIALVALIVLLAKPWVLLDGDPASTALIEPRPSAAARQADDTDSGRPAFDPTRLLAHHCPEPSGWRVFSHQNWGGRNVRSWRSADVASTASGPLDPAIPWIEVRSDEIRLLGYCAPWSGTEAPPTGADVEGWVLAGVLDPRPLTLRRASLPDETSLGGLYLPPAARGGRGGPGEWSSGRFVFHVAGAGFDRWWGVAVVHPNEEAEELPDVHDVPAPANAAS